MVYLQAKASSYPAAFGWLMHTSSKVVTRKQPRRSIDYWHFAMMWDC